jgi:polar amino acid transport system substrate-binding protein
MSPLVFSEKVFSEKLEVVTEEFEPYQYFKNGEIRGQTTEIVKKVLDHAGMEYSINMYPWPRSYDIALHKKNVMIYTIGRTQMREHKFKWVSPLGDELTVYFWKLKKNTHIDLSSSDDAKKYRVAVIRDEASHIWLRSRGFKNIHIVQLQASLPKMLVDEKVDLVALPENYHQTYTEMAAEIGLNKIEKVFPLYSSTPYVALSLSTSDEILFKLQRSFNQLTQEGKIKVPNFHTLPTEKK